MNRILAATRTALGPAPRTVASWEIPKVPTWLKKSDPLFRGYARQPALLASGDLVFGYVVQANANLFEPGPMDHPATVIFGARPDVELDIAALEAIASAASGFKDTTPRDLALRRVADALTKEEERHAPFDLPPAITSGLPARMGDMMIHRAYLPTGQLAACLLPLVVSPARDEAMLLPRALWGVDLVRGYLDLAARAA